MLIPEFNFIELQACYQLLQHTAREPEGSLKIGN